eukprot:scaffold14894_cov74-Phaeocystis_antarctica.AAC.5
MVVGLSFTPRTANSGCVWGEGQANDQSLLFNINANSKGLGCQGPADVQKAGGRGQDRAADRAASALSERP